MSVSKVPVVELIDLQMSEKYFKVIAIGRN